MEYYINTVSSRKEYDWYQIIDELGHRKEPPLFTSLFDKADKFILTKESPSIAVYKHNNSLFLVLEGLYSDNRKAGSGLIHNGIIIGNKHKFSPIQKAILINFLSSKPLGLDVFPGIQTQELLNLSNNITIDKNSGEFRFNNKEFNKIIDSMSIDLTKFEQHLSKNQQLSTIKDSLENRQLLLNILLTSDSENWNENQIICLVSNNHLDIDFKVKYHLSYFASKSSFSKKPIKEKELIATFPNVQENFNEAFKNDLNLYDRLKRKQVFQKKNWIILLSILLFLLCLIFIFKLFS